MSPAGRPVHGRAIWLLVFSFTGLKHLSPGQPEELPARDRAAQFGSRCVVGGRPCTTHACGQPTRAL